jgi:nucleoside 2-deoxyribosyltransferase
VRLRIYLAGPDVFLPDARRVGEEKKRLCEELGFVGLFPFDNEESIGAEAARIFRANCALLKAADIGLFNLTPFRGPSADPGTVFELGFMFAERKPVYGYSSSEERYRERVSAAFGPMRELDGQPRDREGHVVENFDLGDNLMIVRAIEDSGGVFIARQERTETTGGAVLPAFEAFTACLAIIRERHGPT